jgi:ABC-type bacteriocin/lantibiotic exporter with double-glycine peptidase domain
MVMEFFGVKQDEVSLTIQCGTTLAGTGLSELAEAAWRLGFQAEWKTSASFEDLTSAIERSIPAIAMVDARSLHDIEWAVPMGHLIVIIAIKADKVFYHDPEIGPEQSVSRTQFISSWEKLRTGMVTVWRKSGR